MNDGSGDVILSWTDAASGEREPEKCHEGDGQSIHSVSVAIDLQRYIATVQRLSVE